MKLFSERNPLAVGMVGIAVTTGAVLGALGYDKLPFIAGGNSYSAYFAEAGGLVPGAAVHASGYQVGKVSSTALDGPQVLVKFTISKNIHLGADTEAAIKTKNLLGSKILEVTSRGDGELSQPIPLQRTTSPYQLPDALGDLATTISGLDTGQVSDALSTLAQTFHDTPADLREAVNGVARFSEVLNQRDGELRKLLANANKSTAVLAQRSEQVVSLIADSNALLAQLRTESMALDRISTHISALSRQLSAFVAENRAELRPALDKLNGVLTIVDNRKERVQKALKPLNAYALSLGESVSAGPFFNAYIVNLIPGQFLQPYIDVAFGDLGLDPHTLLPSDRTDPPTGQPGTPPLPMPFPRTGRGGDPPMSVSDAITGNPGDPRYPYREPLPPGAPGGPPPGPPMPLPPGDSVPQPTPAPAYVPAPGEAPTSNGGHR